MAQPLRWVLIGLSIKLGISIHEVETFTVPQLREYMAMLQDMADATSGKPRPPREQTPEQMMASFEASFGRFKKE